MNGTYKILNVLHWFFSEHRKYIDEILIYQLDLNLRLKIISDELDFLTIKHLFASDFFGGHKDIVRTPEEKKISDTYEMIRDYLLSNIIVCKDYQDIKNTTIRLVQDIRSFSDNEMIIRGELFGINDIVLDNEGINRIGELVKNKEKKIKPKLKQRTYLVFDGSLYKIGKSVNPNERLKAIKSQNPKAEIIHIIGSDIESLLHNKFKDKRIHHEWFNLSKTEVNYLMTLS